LQKVAQILKKEQIELSNTTLALRSEVEKVDLVYAAMKSNKDHIDIQKN